MAEEKASGPVPPAQTSEQKGEPPTQVESEDLRPQTHILELLGEPSLEKIVEREQLPAIRLIWVRTFHHPISLRAYMTKEGPRFRVARMSGKGGYDWGKLDFENDFPLKDDAWKHLLQLLNEDKARQPFKDAKPGTRGLLLGLDGSTWTLEVVDKSGYTVDQAWSPKSMVEDNDSEMKKIMDDYGVLLRISSNSASFSFNMRQLIQNLFIERSPRF